MSQLTVCVVAVIAPWRLLFHKIFTVWNKRTRLSTTLRNDDATRNATKWPQEILNHLEIRMPLGTLQVDSGKTLITQKWRWQKEYYSLTPRNPYHSLQTRIQPGAINVFSYNFHPKYASWIEKYYTVMAFDANTNTYQGSDGTKKTSFCPAG